MSDLICNQCKKPTKVQEFQPYVMGTKKLMELCKATTIMEYVKKQQIRYAAHIVRSGNDAKTKQLHFNEDKNCKRGRNIPSILEFAAKELQVDLQQFFRIAKMRQEEGFWNNKT